MPRAAGSECQLGSESSAPISGNRVCRGGCGGRLHRICSHHDAASENEMRHLCPACFDDNAGACGPSTDGKGKRKADDSGGVSKGGKQSRTRLTITQKG